MLTAHETRQAFGATTGRVTKVQALDGFPLAATAFGDAPRHVIVASATAVPQTYYRRFASFLASRGWGVTTFDYRGIGGSRHGTLRGFDAKMSDWADKDLAGVVAHVRENAGAKHIAVVGHSIGGAALGLMPNAASIDAFVGVGSGLGDLGLYPAPDRYAFAAFMRAVVPVAAATIGYVPGKLGGGEDLPAGVARQWARWALAPGFFLGGRRAPRREGFALVRAPGLLYSVDDDRYAPKGVVDALADVYVNAHVERRHVAAAEHGGRIGHFGFFRPRHEPTLWTEVADFLDNVETGAPSSRAPSSEEVALDAFLFDRYRRTLS